MKIVLSYLVLCFTTVSFAQNMKKRMFVKKIIGVLIILAFASANSFAFELSNLNGTWDETGCGTTVKFTISGASDVTSLNQPINISIVALALGQTIDETCQVTKIANNEFESRCQANGHNDHSYIQFVSDNTFVETGACGANVATRQ